MKYVPLAVCDKYPQDPAGARQWGTRCTRPCWRKTARHTMFKTLLAQDSGAHDVLRSAILLQYNYSLSAQLSLQLSMRLVLSVHMPLPAALLHLHFHCNDSDPLEMF